MNSTDDITKAVALYYDGSNSPSITAKGIGAEADDIIQIAREHGVTLCDNALLVDLLSKMEVGDNIPSHLYTAIAQILSFAYALDSSCPHLKV